ncbi:unnamed protein product [Larinioides sclopetarius]
MKTFLLFPAFLLLIIADMCSAAAVNLNTTKLQAAKEVDCSKCPMQEKPMDCDELKENGATESGVYTIYPRNRLATCQSIEVYCDMETDGGGWTVIQRRGQYGNGEDYFNKKWSYYKQGFGNLKKEFWLGNDKIYSITNQGQYAVRMEMEHENGKSAFTLYENFWIENENAKYKLHISDASGPGGDAISNHDGYAFYTVDQPNRSGDDQSTRSGGWWRNGKGTSSLNGLNLYKTDKKDSSDGPMQEKPMDCEELKENGVTKSGKYTIYPRNRLASCQSIEVYCDMETDGGGWTVIQRRGQYGNGEDYFNKKWSYYKQGFGNLDKEFWLGNEKIYSITNQGQYAVRMEMEHENGTSAFTVYENFWIENEDAKYKLHISDASGPGGDAISNDDGYVFYTVDQPNRSGDDQSTRSGGWWRNGKGTSSLNGLNLYKTDKEDSSDGIIWVTFGDNKNSLKATEIKVRPEHKKPVDCAELQENGVTKSGVYTIYPRNRLASCQSIEVYCDMETDGGGWTVIQRRGQFGNGEDYFNKKWSYYKQGFGNLNKEFWLGNDKIYSISNQGQYAVRMEMEHENGKSAFTRFENFWIEDEGAKYKLHLSDGSGPGGDAISDHDGYAFYTIDQPNRPGNDQSTRSGGWWRNGKGTSSLNGLNLYKTGKAGSSDGIS